MKISRITAIATSLLVVLSTTFTVLSASAGVNGKTLAIIDFTFDSSATEIKERVISDVCFSITKSCTIVPKDKLYANLSLSHGTIMASVASQIDPTMKLVLIRVGNINPKTFTVSAMSTTEFDNVLISAFDWIAQNATRLNIAAVSTSMSHTSFNALGSYCPNRKSSVYPGTLEDRVLKLQNLGIASVFSAGNTYDNLRVSYPACIKASFAIGATEFPEGSINPVSLKSAKGPDVDFYALGTYQLSFIRMTGQTSPAAAAFATYWVNKYQGNFQDTLTLINSLRSEAYFSATKLSTKSFINVLK